jgi:hypothetical protein
MIIIMREMEKDVKIVITARQEMIGIMKDAQEMTVGMTAEMTVKIGVRMTMEGEKIIRHHHPETEVTIMAHHHLVDHQDHLHRVV